MELLANLHLNGTNLPQLREKEKEKEREREGRGRKRRPAS